MFNRKSAFKVRDFQTDAAAIVTPENVTRLFDALHLFEGEDLMCEAVSLAEIEHHYIGDELALSFDQYLRVTPEGDQALFEAVSSTKAALIRTMRAFTRKLNAQLANSDIKAGTDATSTPEDDSTASTAGGAEISPVRRIAGVPVVIARIPLSDGQSVSIAFQSPTSQTGQLQNNDLLVAFRFLLNKRDITHTVAPKGGVDASLSQVTLMLARLIERNSPKFAKTQAMAARMRQSIAEKENELEAITTQQTQLVQQGDALVSTNAGLDTQITDTSTKLQKQQDINSKLQEELARLKAIQPEPTPPTPTPPAGDTSTATGIPFKFPELSSITDVTSAQNYLQMIKTAIQVISESIYDYDYSRLIDAQQRMEYRLVQRVRVWRGLNVPTEYVDSLEKYMTAPKGSRREPLLQDIKNRKSVLEQVSSQLEARIAELQKDTSTPTPTPPAGGTHPGTKKPTDTTPPEPGTTQQLGALKLPDLTKLSQDVLENFAHHLQVAVDALTNTASDLATQSRDRALYNLEYAADEIRNDRVNDTPDELRQLIMPYLDRPLDNFQETVTRREEAVDIALDVVKSELKKRAAQPEPTTPKTLDFPDPTTLDDEDTVSNYLDTLHDVLGLLQDVFSTYQQQEPAQAATEMESKVSRLENSLAAEGIESDVIAQVSDFLTTPTSNDKYTALGDIKERFDLVSPMVQAYDKRLLQIQDAASGKNTNHLNLPDPATITNRMEVIAILGLMQQLRSYIDDMAGYFATKTLAQARQNAADIISAQKPRWESQGIPEDIISQATALLLPNEGGRKQPIIDDLKARKADIEKQIPAWDAQNQKLKAAALADAPARIALENAIRDAKRVISDSMEFEADKEGEITDQQGKLEAAIKVLTDNGVTGWDDDIEMARYELSTQLQQIRARDALDTDNEDELTAEDMLGEVISDLERAGVIVSQKDQDALRNNPGLSSDIYAEFRAAQTAWQNGGARYDTEKEAMKAWAEAKLRGEPRPNELTTAADKFMEFMRRDGVGLDPHVYDMIMKYPEALRLAELSTENAYNDPDWIDGDKANNKRLLEAYVDGAVGDFKEPDNRTQEEKDVEQAIATLQEIQKDPSAEMGQMREDRQFIRDAVATLKAAGKYDENEALVNATIDYVAQKMISVARGIQ
ncbi:hypothetical protein QMM96_22545 [Citrobacter freundii]|uniref:defense against restriction DarA-related protein n=1 Tax=Citrobacter freundii TaxID=546 RepID=UPI002B247D3D|nr:hypothetical protein [Citrobacter freundii]MEB2478213.1 hypothetical protein [Citrobacter freundii]